MAVASKGYFAISRETTPGTAVTPPTKFYPLEEVTVDFGKEFQDWRELRLSRQAYRTIDGAHRPSVTIRGPVYPSGAMGSFLVGTFGADSAAAESTSITAFRHSFVDAATLPYYTIERSDAANGAGGILCERIAGCKVESFGLSAAYGEKVNFNATFQAMKKPTSGHTPVSAATATAGMPVMKALYFKGSTVEIDDTANNFFKSINLEIRNTLERQESLRGIDESYKIFEGGLDCTLSGTMVFEDLTVYQKMVAGTPMKIELIMLSDTIADATPTPDVYYEMKYQWDTVQLSSYGLPFTAGEVVNAEVEFKVNFDTTNSRSVAPSIVNLDTATAYDT